MLFSRAYNFVRARQLEGNYPGDPREGVWGISANRICCGWGEVDESVWPYFRPDSEDYFAPEPRGVDEVAKRHRIRYYFRVRSAAECRKVLAHNVAVLKATRRRRPPPEPGMLSMSAAFEITEQFVNAAQGVVLDPREDARIVGSHGVLLVTDCVAQKSFEFLNSWGENWGYRGLGYLSYEFFDRWMIDAWSYPTQPASEPTRSGIATHGWTAPYVLGHLLHGFEIFDHASDEKLAWAFAAQRGERLEVEELFVKPVHRGKGYGGQLADRLVEFAAESQLSLSAWVSFADCGEENRPALTSILKRLRLAARPSQERWAAYQPVPRARRANGFVPIRVPARPSYVRPGKSTGQSLEAHSLRGSVVSYEDPFGPAAPLEDWDALN